MRHVTADTETRAFVPGCMAPKIVSLALTRDGVRPELYANDDIYDVVDWLLNQEAIVWHNACFDMTVLLANWPHLAKRIFDAYDEDRIKCTLIREALHVLAIGEMQDDRGRGNLSLAATYQRRTGKYLVGKKDGEDSARLNYHKVEGLPISEWPSEFVEYASKDPLVTDEIFLQQEDLPDEENQTRAAFALHLMASTGFRAHPERVKKLRETLEARIARLTGLLVPTGIVRPSGSVNQKLLRAFVEKQYTDLGWPTPYVVKKGKARLEEERKIAAGEPVKPPNVSYAAETIAELPCSGPVECNDEAFVVCDNPLHHYKARTEDTGELSKYVEVLEVAVHTPVNASVTSLVSTGRTSMSKPPLQQLPKRYGVRQCIIPPEGHYFIGADFSAIELTTFGQICLDMFGQSALAEVIQARKDPHCVTASMLLDISYETALLRKEDEDDTEFDKIRDLSKALAFGTMGGMGAETFIGYAKGYGYRYEGTLDEQIEKARDHIKVFKTTYPEVKEYLKRIGQACDQGGGFFDLKQPRSGRIRGQVGFTNGANSPFQGLAADLAKDAIWHITKEMFLPLRTALFGSRLVIFMHDEMVSRAPIEIAAEAAERQSALMLEAAARWCPDVPTKASPWISREWDKRAKTVRDANGRLVVWEPPRLVT